MKNVAVPRTKSFTVFNHHVKLIQFRPGESVNIRITVKTPNNNKILFNIMEYVMTEGMATETFLLAK